MPKKEIQGLPIKFSLGYHRVGKQPLPRQEFDIGRIVHTGLLLLEGHLVPVNLHTVTELHPQLGLLLRGHALPALLDAGQGRVRDGVVGRSAGLHSIQRGQWAGTDGGRAARSSASDGAKKHCAAGGRWEHHVENESIDGGEGVRDQRSLAARGTRLEKRVEGEGRGDGEGLKLSWWFEVESREVSGLALAWFIRPLIGPLPSPAASEHHHHSQQYHTMREWANIV